MRGLKKIILCVLLGVSSSSCSLFSSSPSPDELGPQSRVFKAKFEEVWRATQIALSNYPIRINNMETGIIETDIIRGSSTWKTPGERKKKSGRKYTLHTQVVQGKARNSRVVKVIVEKKIEHQRNFFAQSKALNSDGLEEQVLLYRIGREIKIERSLQRVLKKSN